MDVSVLVNFTAEIIVAVLSIVIARYLVPFLKERYTKEKVSNIYDTILKAVQAAEQLYQESGSGVLKKEYVINYINNLGIKITEAELNVFIESAVKVITVLGDEIKKE